METTKRYDVSRGGRRSRLVGNGKQFRLTGVHELFVPLSNVRHLASGDGGESNLFLLHDVGFIKSIAFLTGQTLIDRFEQLHPHGSFFQWSNQLGDVVQGGFVSGQFAIKGSFLSPDLSLHGFDVFLGVIPLLFAP